MDNNQSMKNRPLFRSRTNRTVAGIIGGLAEVYDIDPTLLRLIYLAVTVFTGFFPGIILYLIAIFIIPLERPA